MPFLPARHTYQEHQLIANGDYLINSKNTLAMRYFYTNNPQSLPLSGGLRPARRRTSFYTNTDAAIKLTTLLTTVHGERTAIRSSATNGQFAATPRLQRHSRSARRQLFPPRLK